MNKKNKWIYKYGFSQWNINSLWNSCLHYPWLYLFFVNTKNSLITTYYYFLYDKTKSLLKNHKYYATNAAKYLLLLTQHQDFN